MNLPNALTLGRIFLVPLLVVVLLTKFEGHIVLGVRKELLGAATLAKLARGAFTETTEAATEVADHVIRESLKAGKPFDLRDLTHKGLPRRLQCDRGDAECSWQRLVSATIGQRFVEPAPGELPDSPKLLSKDRLAAIAAEIAATNDRGEEARAEEWQARTGKSKRTYYRFLERAKRQK